MKPAVLDTTAAAVVSSIGGSYPFCPFASLYQDTAVDVRRFCRGELCPVPHNPSEPVSGTFRFKVLGDSPECAEALAGAGEAVGTVKALLQLEMCLGLHSLKGDTQTGLHEN